MDALYRERPGADWREVEIIEVRPDGVVAREVGRALPGVILAWADRFRVPVGVIEQPEILSRPGLGPKRWGKYRTIREVCGRDVALQTVLEP
jgi:hypothetical protein